MKKILKISILALTIIFINININVFCNDNYINNKLNKFIENETDAKYILAYLDHNFINIEDVIIKENMIDKVIDYNEKKLHSYQLEFDKMYKKNVRNIQTKQNLKSELNILNDMNNYKDISVHKFNFIDNKPDIVKNLKEIYLSGYKIVLKNNKFKLKVNYGLLQKNH
ncbi:hypothetical protein GCM10008904_25600 [Paraclostridium ghonii]|uniref:Uncharacterized protein n=1 Tax=Paraclostridium ghonii TaxID=29358 RepID=A0ABU0MZD4_9FIRM|nr:hypothetical protein [Paeniclostridium ghonii]MDQ0556089.1 hypothetical protein [Paeniclostridium ghonii]